MKKLRVLVLTHIDLVPPLTLEGYTEEEIAEWKMEFDVVGTLENMGHDVRTVGVLDDLNPIRQQIDQWKPHIAFMLLEEFHQVVAYDQAVVSYLELMRQPYTGCNPRGMLLSRDKALSKKILTYHHIPTPRFTVHPIGTKVHRPARLLFPLFVKSIDEDASYGISAESIVYDDQALIDRVRFIHEEVGTGALVEQYIEGRELYMGVLGNDRLQTFPLWEMRFRKKRDRTPRIATAKAKWDTKYQKQHGIETGPVEDLSPAELQRIARIVKRVYRSLNMSGYGRMDLRLTEDGRVYVLEANANPNLSYGEDFAESADTIGLSYERLLQRIMNLGLRYKAPWKILRTRRL